METEQSDKINEVYEVERRRLFSYIRNKISNNLDADDILQDVFYQLTIGFQDIRRLINLRSGFTEWLTTAFPIYSGKRNQFYSVALNLKRMMKIV